MGRFDMSEEDVAKFRQMLLDAAQPKLAEPIVAAAAFRRGGAASSMIASKAGLGGLVHAGLSLRNKKKAGGLPERVLIAATAEKVHVFKLKIGKVYGAGDEVAVWDRAALRASTEKKMNVTMLTLESPAEGEKVTLAPVGVVDDPVSQELMALLTGAQTAI
jgi:hypothetical protein